MKYIKHTRTDQVKEINKKVNSLLDNRQLRENPFSVPENYFEKLPQRIESRLKEAGRITTEVHNRSHSLHPWLYAAAAVFAFGLVAFFLFLAKERSHPSITSPALTQALSKHPKETGALTSQVTGSTLNQHNDLSDTDDVNIGTTNSYIENSYTRVKPEDQLSDDDIINYLLEEDIDLTDLIN
ncbi:MAG: hypothetical protein NTU44_12685 [Bacteroidetes bacterium]|nr:hypothetical protein [Bacteroidota bacterium]